MTFRMAASLILCLAGTTALRDEDAQPVDSFATEVAPTLDAHCIECHGATKAKAGLDLSVFANSTEALAQPEVWELVQEALADGDMPPSKAVSHPTAEEVARTLQWIETSFADGSMVRSDREPGRTTLRRLNRNEYRNAVLDLFGVDYPSLDRLPVDGVAHGFDVIGEALTMSPVLFEKYFEAAEQIARAALPAPGEAQVETRHFAAHELELSDPKYFRENAKAVYLFSNGFAAANVNIERSGDYLIRVLAGAQQAGDELAEMRVSANRKPIETIAVEAGMRDPHEHDIRIGLELGAHTIEAGFTNDYYDPNFPDPQRRDRNLMVGWLELVGPLDAPKSTPFEMRFVDGASERKSPEAVLEQIAPLAWRGPVEPETIAALLEIAGPEAQNDERLRVALTTLLTSPRFLFRVEPEPTEESRNLDGFELASRLAAFLWNSVPDEALLEMAATGELLRPSGFDPQVRRMLRDARATRMSTGFANQWLQLGRLNDSYPDGARFPTFDEDLRQAMQRESELFFDAILRENRPVDELLSADFTFVNEKLAKHYGILGVTGAAMQRVPLPAAVAERRGGVLGQAGPLTATSHPTRTSPVKRGKWVMESLLATPPPPPPPGVDALDESHKAASSASVRDRLAIHRENPECASCHDSMDGLGLALENFNGIGGWRETDGNFPIDASAQLPKGPAFSGPSGLRERLLGDGSFRAGLARHLMTYALGRGLADQDEDQLDELLAGLPTDTSLAELIHAITRTNAFQRHYRDQTQ